MKTTNLTPATFAATLAATETTPEELAQALAWLQGYKAARLYAAQLAVKPSPSPDPDLPPGALPIGSAVKMRRWSYHISPELLRKYLGDFGETPKQNSAENPDASDCVIEIFPEIENA